MRCVLLVSAILALAAIPGTRGVLAEPGPSADRAAPDIHLDCPRGAVIRRSKSGRVRTRYCEKMPGRVVHGPWIKIHEDGRKLVEGSFTDGERDGLWTQWWPNGQERTRGRFAGGRRDGAWAAWSERGEPVAAGRFHAGRPVGQWTYRFDGIERRMPGITFSPEHAGHDARIETDHLEVLGVDLARGLIAFRHVYSFPDRSPECGLKPSIDCGYAGMREHPRSGVVLGLYRLEDHTISKRFVVYRPARSRRECTPMPRARRALAEAKAFFRERGLDIDQRPSPIAGRRTSTGTFFAAGGAGDEPRLWATVESISDISQLVERERRDPVLALYNEELCIDSSVSIGTIFLDGRMVYRRFFTDSTEMASWGLLDYPEMYRIGHTALVRERHRHLDGHCGSTAEAFFFSDPIELAE
ncbi:MAG: hypothetical protein JXR96_19650 [Deltaproteobacteria bacterium]|nr:hypothetical protein [Deltaproteobacteria bacterium]